MRSPSARVLYNRVDAYQAGSGRDADGGVVEPYPSLPTYKAMPCTAQPVHSMEIEDQQRITKITEWRFIFRAYLGLNLRDKLIWQDPAGTIHAAYVTADRDEAGRGAAFSVYAEERV
jgi:hypothetical protein